MVFLIQMLGLLFVINTAFAFSMMLQGEVQQGKFTQREQDGNLHNQKEVDMAYDQYIVTNILIGFALIVGLLISFFGLSEF